VCVCVCVLSTDSCIAHTRSVYTRLRDRVTIDDIIMRRAQVYPLYDLHAGRVGAGAGYNACRFEIVSDHPAVIREKGEGESQQQREINK